jgi:hypothetical protein
MMSPHRGELFGALLLIGRVNLRSQNVKLDTFSQVFHTSVECIASMQKTMCLITLLPDGLPSAGIPSFISEVAGSIVGCALILGT